MAHYGNKTEKPAYSEKENASKTSLNRPGPKGRGGPVNSLNQPGSGGMKACCIKGFEGKPIPQNEQ